MMVVARSSIAASPSCNESIGADFFGCFLHEEHGAGVSWYLDLL